MHKESGKIMTAKPINEDELSKILLDAVVAAIKEIGVDAFKSTSFFMSSNQKKS